MKVGDKVSHCVGSHLLYCTESNISFDYVVLLGISEQSKKKNAKAYADLDLWKPCTCS